MEINILGNDYKIIVRKKQTKAMEKAGSVAQIDKNREEITLITQTEDGDKKRDKYILRDLAHEMAHAYLFETGQESNDTEEFAEAVSVIVTDILYHKKYKDMFRIIREVKR